MLEIPDDKAQKALKGVMMELDDCAFPLLCAMVATADPNVAFRDADIALANEVLHRRLTCRDRIGIVRILLRLACHEPDVHQNCCALAEHVAQARICAGDAIGEASLPLCERVEWARGIGGLCGERRDGDQ